MTRTARFFLPILIVTVAGLLHACMAGDPESEWGVGQAFPERTLNDAHGEPMELPGEARILLKTVEMAPANIVNSVLGEWSAEELEAAGVVYIADIHPMPPNVMENVVLPRMQAREYRTLITRTEADVGFLPHTPEQVTVVFLDAGSVTGIEHAADEEALRRLLAAAIE